MSAKKWSKRRTMQAICIACYIIVPIFFCIFYFLMTMSYEDILHHSWHAGGNTGTILAYVYNYLPRLGEFYQNLTMRFMDAQVSLGFGLILRFFDAVMCTALIYLLTVFVLKRRPRLSNKDALVYLGLFVLLMLFETSEVFMYRFSYVHNYILAMLAMVGFLLPYRLNLRTTKPLALVGMLLLGFLFGISTEIAPIAILIILVASAIIHKITQKPTVKQFLQQYRLQITGFIGILLGLIFFYVGAGLDSRANGGYSIIYEYIHISAIFSAPLRTIPALIDHFWYNIRYFAFALVLLLFIIFSAFVRHKQSKPNQLPFYLHILAFCILFLGASSLIKLHDDMYVRFLFPIYVAVFVGIFTFLSEQLSRTDVDLQTFAKVSCIVLLGVGALMTVDMTYAMVRYHSKVAPVTNNEITIQNDGNLHFAGELPDDPYMVSSPIFHFRQLTPVNWDNDNIYMKYDN